MTGTYALTLTVYLDKVTDQAAERVLEALIAVGETHGRVTEADSSLVLRWDEKKEI